jgi:hypothetical protein
MTGKVATWKRHHACPIALMHRGFRPAYRLEKNFEDLARRGIVTVRQFSPWTGFLFTGAALGILRERGWAHGLSRVLLVANSGALQPFPRLKI